MPYTTPPSIEASPEKIAERLERQKSEALGSDPMPPELLPAERPAFTPEQVKTLDAVLKLNHEASSLPHERIMDMATHLYTRLDKAANRYSPAASVKLVTSLLRLIERNIEATAEHENMKLRVELAKINAAVTRKSEKKIKVEHSHVSENRGKGDDVPAPMNVVIKTHHHIKP